MCSSYKLGAGAASHALAGNKAQPEQAVILECLKHQQLAAVVASMVFTLALHWRWCAFTSCLWMPGWVGVAMHYATAMKASPSLQWQKQLGAAAAHDYPHALYPVHEMDLLVCMLLMVNEPLASLSHFRIISGFRISTPKNKTALG